MLSLEQPLHLYLLLSLENQDFPGDAVYVCVKSPHLPMQEIKEMWVRSLGQEDPLEKGMATHSSILSWRIPQTEESGGLQSIGCQRVGHD